MLDVTRQLNPNYVYSYGFLLMHDGGSGLKLNDGSDVKL